MDLCNTACGFLQCAVVLLRDSDSMKEEMKWIMKYVTVTADQWQLR